MSGSSSTEEVLDSAGILKVELIEDSKIVDDRLVVGRKPNYG
jgi:hypothetical protein